MRPRTLAWIFCLTVLTVPCMQSMSVAQVVPSSRIHQEMQVHANYGQLPLTFEANQGQTDGQVTFLSRERGYRAFLTADGMVLSLRPSEIATPDTSIAGAFKTAPTTLQFRLVGAARNPAVVGEDLQPGKVNYFLGNDPAQWHTNVSTYGRVRYKNIYPGIDLVYHGNHQQLEYDFEASPRADLSRITFEITGARQTKLDAEGNLILETASGNLNFQSPTVYQQSHGLQVPVKGAYVVDDSSRISFHLANYDPALPLVIDPVLVYSTYLGGAGNEQPSGIVVDSTGSAYVVGSTDSPDFPLTTLSAAAAGDSHAFVAKLDPTGQNLIYADYLGGNNTDFGYALVLDNANEVYLAGSTSSSNFPLVNPYQNSAPGPYSAFVSKISADGSALLYSTYLGGNTWEQPSSIVITALGEVLVAGSTQSLNFPVVNAYQATASANQGGLYGSYGFLTKFNASGSSLSYSTYFGGASNVIQQCWNGPCWPNPYNIVLGMVLDANGNAYVTGNTNTYDFPVTSGAYLTTNSAQQDGIVSFVSKFSGSGTLDYSTYLYGNNGSAAQTAAIAVDGSSAAYVTGSATNGTYPITSTAICDPNAYGQTCGNTFVSKFDSAGSSLLYSTFLGPNNAATPQALALDSNNNAYVLASTSSGSFNLVNGLESYGNGSDILLSEIDAAGTTQLLATYLGGTGTELPAGIAVDASGNIYVAGSTDSTDFPVTVPTVQNLSGGNSDAFVLKIGPNSAPAFSPTPAALQFASAAVGATSTAQTVLVRNMGSAALSISSISTTGDFGQTNTCGSDVPAASTCTISVTFLPTAEGNRSGAILVQDNAAGSPHSVALSGNGLGGVVGLTPSRLTFSATPLGASDSQAVTLSNAGNAVLNLGNIHANGDYAQSNTCPAALAVGSHCVITVKFTPAASGTRTGTLTVNDDATGSPQTVTLTGTGSDFSVAGSPTSDTLNVGSTATYSLTIAALGGSFTSAVSLACSGAPDRATCSISPTQVIPGAAGTTAVLTVSATPISQLSPLRPLQVRALYVALIQLQGLGLFGVLLAGSKRRSSKLPKALLLTILMAAIAYTCACAGGTGTTTQSKKGTPAGTYTITVTGSSGNLQHSVPLKLIVQ